MGGFNIVPMPLGDPIARPIRPEFIGGKVDPRAGTMPDSWVKFLTSVTQTVSQQPLRIRASSSTGQTASITSTNLTAGAISTGLYRITHYTRVTQAASSSSSLSVTYAWTDGGVPQSITFAAITGNTTTTNDSRTFSVHADAASPITYATTYASVGGTVMAYRLDIWLEQIAA